MAMPCCSSPSTTSILLPSKSFATSIPLTPTLLSTSILSFSLYTSHPSSQIHCSSINSTSPIDPLPLQSPPPIVFVKGLSISTSEGHLKKTFMQFGEVSRVKVAVDKKTKQSLGYAYIWFESEKSAQLAMKEMDGKVYFCYICKAGIVQTYKEGNTIQVLSEQLTPIFSSTSPPFHDRQAVQRVLP